MEFNIFKTAVTKQFDRMQKHQLFRVNVDKDALYEMYLNSFPTGTNPMFRERAEHDCSCCKNFIRSIGNVVAIIDGKVESIWDVKTPKEPGYQVVADAMSNLVHASAINDAFLHYESKVGTNNNFETILDKVMTWEHFYVDLKPQYVKKNADIATELGLTRSTRDVFLRALKELTDESVDTVLELIAQNTVYRGSEYKHILNEFKESKQKFNLLPTDQDKELFAWSSIVGGEVHGAVAGIRNTAMGSLLIDLSEGKEIDAALTSFEGKMSAGNYKRPTAAVTPKMIEAAKEKVEELGLTSALQRRYATINDITINNVMFADRTARKEMKGDVFDALASTMSGKRKNLDKVEEVTIDKFIADILPKIDSLEVMFNNNQISNLVSLIAPIDPNAGNIFKWDNKFSWSYNGEVADSYIRKEVQVRGGSVDGVFRFSHSWNHNKRNASLMDLHVFMPGNEVTTQNAINDDYGNYLRVGWNHRNHHQSGGIQDVDYTAAAPVGYIPVENITFPSLDRMPEGKYICKIHNWDLRSPTHGGFKAEIEFGGQVFQYDYDKPMKNKEWVTVAVVTLKGGVFTIEHHLPVADSIVKTVWGVPSQTFQKVNVMMMSPNYWDEKQVGNKHYFFMLDGCINDGTARSFFNEFLKDDLSAHRKVFEMVGSKTKVADSPEQLSGLGFSSTQKNTLICRVKGSFTRNLKIVF